MPTPISIIGANPQENGPESIVARFMIAIEHNDIITQQTCLRAAQASELTKHSIVKDFTTAEIGVALPISDDRYHVPIFLSNSQRQQEFTFCLYAENGSWKIDVNESIKITFKTEPMTIIQQSINDMNNEIGTLMSHASESISAAIDILQEELLTPRKSKKKYITHKCIPIPQTHAILQPLLKTKKNKKSLPTKQRVKNKKTFRTKEKNLQKPPSKSRQTNRR